MGHDFSFWFRFCVARVGFAAPMGSKRYGDGELETASMIRRPAGFEVLLEAWVGSTV